MFSKHGKTRKKEGKERKNPSFLTTRCQKVEVVTIKIEIWS